MGGVLQGLAAWLKTVLPALLGYLAGRSSADATRAKADAETLAKQNEIAARPDVSDADLDRWLRR